MNIIMMLKRLLQRVRLKFNQDQTQWVEISVTDLFICIDTFSGLGLVGRDPLFPSHLLPPDADDECIGKKILLALSDSRTMTNREERAELFGREQVKSNYKAWIDMLMGQYGYKTKKSLFKGMRKCGAHCINGVIEISPSNHYKLESWGTTKDDGIEDVILSTDNTPAEIGAGFRLALGRCRG